MICQFFKIMGEYFTSQYFVVKVFSSRESGYTSLEPAFYRVSSNIIRSSIPAVGKQKLAIGESFLSKILQICPVHSLR